MENKNIFKAMNVYEYKDGKPVLPEWVTQETVEIKKESVCSCFDCCFMSIRFCTDIWKTLGANPYVVGYCGHINSSCNPAGIPNSAMSLIKIKHLKNDEEIKYIPKWCPFRNENQKKDSTV